VPVVSPGALVELVGGGLTLGSTLNAGVPLPYKLAGTTVRFGAASAPLFSVAPERVLAQVPFGLAVGQPIELAVTVGSTRAVSPITIRESSPRVLGVVGDGPVISIYATGLGEVDPPVATGQPAPLVPLSLARRAPQVRVKGLPTEVQFAGLAPGLVAIYQVNVRLPDGAVATDPITFE
jgi:hypothetical protein